MACLRTVMACEATINSKIVLVFTFFSDIARLYGGILRGQRKRKLKRRKYGE